MQFVNCCVEATKLRFREDHFHPLVNTTEVSRVRNAWQRETTSKKSYGQFGETDLQVQLHGGRRAGLTLGILFPGAHRVFVDFWASRGDFCLFDYWKDDEDKAKISFRRLKIISGLPLRHRYAGINHEPVLDRSHWATSFLERLHGDSELEIEFYCSYAQVSNLLVDIKSASEAAYEQEKTSATVFSQLGDADDGNKRENRESAPSKVKSEPAVMFFSDNIDYEQRQLAAFRPESIYQAEQKRKIDDAASGQWNARVLKSSPTTMVLELSRLGSQRDKPGLEVGWLFGLEVVDYKYGTKFGNWHGSVVKSSGEEKWELLAKRLERGNGIPGKCPKQHDGILLKLKGKGSLISERKIMGAIKKFAHLEDDPEALPWGSMKKGLAGTVKRYSFPNKFAADYAKRGSYGLVVANVLRKSLNEMQNEAFERALRPKMGVSLTIGPPGTGKTALIVAVATAFAVYGYHVIICGPSNRQLDDIAAKCEKKKNDCRQYLDPEYTVVRLYPPTREFFELMKQEDEIAEEGESEDWERQDVVRSLVQVPELSLTKHTMKQIEANDKQTSELLTLGQKGWAYKRTSYPDWTLPGFSTEMKFWLAVVCTCQSAANPVLREGKGGFDVMINDEATQLLEGTSLVPMMAYSDSKVKGNRKLKSLYAVGDPRQLGAVTKSRKENNPAHNQLDTDLFSRLRELGFETTMLVRQYRMRPEIEEFANKTFYDNKLETGYCESDNSKKWDEFSRRMNWPMGMFALYTANTDAKRDYNSSWYNKTHVKIVVAVIERASRDAALPLSEFGIVVGYKAQKTEYERRLADKIQEDPEWAKVIVGTIDEMEGREVGIEIFDLTITAQAKQNATQIGVGFLADDRRVNVAVTRAKYGLVIFSDRDYMKRVDQFARGLKALCDHLKGKGRPWKGFEKQSGDGKRKRSADDADDANDDEKKRKGAVEDGEELEEGEILED